MIGHNTASLVNRLGFCENPTAVAERTRPARLESPASTTKNSRDLGLPAEVGRGKKKVCVGRMNYTYVSDSTASPGALPKFSVILSLDWRYSILN